MWLCYCNNVCEVSREGRRVCRCTSLSRPTLPSTSPELSAFHDAFPPTHRSLSLKRSVYALLSGTETRRSATIPSNVSIPHLRRELPSDGQAERKGVKRDLRLDIAVAGCICKEGRGRPPPPPPASLKFKRKDGGRGPARTAKGPQNRAPGRSLVHSSGHVLYFLFGRLLRPRPGRQARNGQFDRSGFNVGTRLPVGCGGLPRTLGGASERAPPPPTGPRLCVGRSGRQV